MKDNELKGIKGIKEYKPIYWKKGRKYQSLVLGVVGIIISISGISFSNLKILGLGTLAIILAIIFWKTA